MEKSIDGRTAVTSGGSRRIGLTIVGEIVARRNIIFPTKTGNPNLRLPEIVHSTALELSSAAGNGAVAVSDVHNDSDVTVGAELQTEATAQRLFFQEDEHEARLTNLEYALLADLTSWSPRIAPEALNSSPRDTGNTQLLFRFGTPAQQKERLNPLLNGSMRSCFSTTEPHVASSDANNMRLRTRHDVDEWVLTGRKLWPSVHCGRTAKSSWSRASRIPKVQLANATVLGLVSFGTSGMDILCSTHALGFNDRREGYAEIEFDSAQVPLCRVLGDRVAGFTAAQAGIGLNRLHHCERLIGKGKRAIVFMRARAQNRAMWGTFMPEQGVAQTWITDARTNINAAWLIALRAARCINAKGNKAVRHDIAEAKIMVLKVVMNVVGNEIQLFGGGLAQDALLPVLYGQARFAQIADDPDEVHWQSLAHEEFAATPALQLS